MSEGGGNGIQARVAVPVEAPTIEDLARRVAELEKLLRARPEGPVPMVAVEDVVAEQKKRGEDAHLLPPPTFQQKYRDRSMTVICPTRGMIPCEVVESWNGIIWPMNQARSFHFAKKYEVGEAYNAFVRTILGHDILKRRRFVLSLEDDNLIPYEGIMRLFETLEAGPEGDGSSEWDSVGALYFTKGPCVAMPMCYGDAHRYRHGDGKLDFSPIDLSAVDLSRCRGKECRGKLDGCPHVQEALALAQGCTIYKTSLFAETSPPWFLTCPDKIIVEGVPMEPKDADPIITANPGQDYQRFVTQDFFWYSKIIRPPLSRRVACDMRVVSGHLDVTNGRIY